MLIFKLYFLGQIIGNIYEDNFNSGSLTDKWKGPYITNEAMSPEYVNSKYGSDRCMKFT